MGDIMYYAGYCDGGGYEDYEGWPDFTYPTKRKTFKGYKEYYTSEMLSYIEDEYLCRIPAYLHRKGHCKEISDLPKTIIEEINKRGFALKSNFYVDRE